ncbi:candidate histidine kinase, classic [Ramlibacter tataouinensis TTB310]|uniref:histidine kinase n=1 Tax=Ramlibacter tataouinensis (strain ATCC BAA-407 / DSM 14655 / LMG 21543 / TTB310) TaxID=365046 RepID=F5Y4D7_RAMTT|nr:candidate histidine kinase, classic [Ramlibacter tataouinensis TTB310]
MPAAAATAASAVLDPAMSVAGLAMVYLVAAVAGAVVLAMGPAALAALLCVVALNYFFVPPRRSLSVDGPEYWWLLASLLGLTLGLNALVARLRERRQQAERGQVQAAELHALGEAMALTRDHHAMARAAAAFLHGTLDLPCAVFLTQDTEGALTREAAPADGAFQRQPAEWAIANGRPLGRGCLDWPELPLWCAPFSRHRPAGAVQLLLPARAAPPADTVAHWHALARQVGLAVERERAAAAAARAEQAASAEAARNTLLASLSHDLRTPLAGIVGTASLLRIRGDDMPGLERQRLLGSLEDEALDMASMADNILQVARLSQPLAQLGLRWESIEDVLGAAVARVRRRWPQASIQLRAPHGLPPVQAEAGLLAQAIANLVDNAVRHGGSPPRIAVQLGKSREGVFIAVRDHGTGLPPGDPAKLFARWRSAAGGRAGGTGLGLAICQLCVQAHGGRITAKRCEPGAEFRVDLPAAAVPVQDPA